MDVIRKHALTIVSMSQSVMGIVVASIGLGYTVTDPEKSESVLKVSNVILISVFILSFILEIVYRDRPKELPITEIVWDLYVIYLCAANLFDGGNISVEKMYTYNIVLLIGSILLGAKTIYTSFLKKSKKVSYAPELPNV